MAERQLRTMFRPFPSSLAQRRRLHAFTYHTQAQEHRQASTFRHPQLRAQLLPSTRTPHFHWISTNPRVKGKKEDTREKPMNSETGDDKASEEKGGKNYEDMNEEENKEAEKGDFWPLAPWIVTAFAAWYIQGSGRRKSMDWEDENKANENPGAP